MTDPEILFRYTACGLDNVWLASGFRRLDTEYGPGFAIDDADNLHRAIARAMVDSPHPLRRQDARFLRRMLELSQGDMARLPGVDRTTIIRWEGAHDKPLAAMADLAVCLTYTSRAGGGLIDTVVRELQEADDDKHGDRSRAVFEARSSGWHSAAA